MEATDIFVRLRKTLMKTEAIIVAGILLTEVIMYGILVGIGIEDNGAEKYFLKYLAVPLLVNAAIFLTGSLLMDREDIPWKLRNYIPLACMSATCACMSYIHQLFAVTMCFACTVIIISGVFGSTVMARRITWLNIALLLLTQLLPDYDGVPKDVYTYLNLAVTVAFFALTNLFTRIIIIYQRESNSIIRAAQTRVGDLEKKLKRDRMTGLYNHAAFMEFLSFEYMQCAQERKALSLAILDIDDFKKVNDCYGHENGDQVLMTLASVLLAACRDYGYVCRYGGEEFAILFPGYSYKEALVFMEQARLDFAGRQYGFLPFNQKITFSCGIWEDSLGVSSYQELFELADQQLYQAKRTGKNRTAAGKSSQASGLFGELNTGLEKDIDRIAGKYGKDGCRDEMP